MPTPEPVILSWDYGEQPDLDRLAAAVRDMSGGAVHMHEVDTGSSDYAIVVAPTQLDEHAVADMWNRHHCGEEN
jgi:hypothetical protein